MRRGLNVLFGSSVAAAALLVATQPAGGHSARSASKPSAGQFQGACNQQKFMVVISMGHRLASVVEGANNPNLNLAMRLG
jgi:hypothetical protein